MGHEVLIAQPGVSCWLPVVSSCCSQPFILPVYILWDGIKLHFGVSLSTAITADSTTYSCIFQIMSTFGLSLIFPRVRKSRQDGRHISHRHIYIDAALSAESYVEVTAILDVAKWSIGEDASCAAWKCTNRFTVQTRSHGITFHR